MEGDYYKIPGVMSCFNNGNQLVKVLFLFKA